MGLTDILNLLSKKLVWEKPIRFEKAASIQESLLENARVIKKASKIRGIGYSHYNKKICFDFFVSFNYDINKISYIARRLNINYRTFRTNEFISYAISPTVPVITSGNAVKHFRFN